jgi:hypothetical protein
MRLWLALGCAVLAAALATPLADAGFPAGQCTTWAYLMRPDIVADAALNGVDVTDWNAWRWTANARMTGFSTGGAPKVGAIAVWPPHVLGAGPVGHVAYVQQVRSNGSFYISEEDYNGSPNVHRRWVQPSSQLSFVYLLPGEHAPARPMTPGGSVESLSSAGTYSSSDLSQTTVVFTISAATTLALHFTGPSVNRTLTYHAPAGQLTLALDKIAGTETLPDGSYKLVAYAYDLSAAWRYLTFTLG